MILMHLVLSFACFQSEHSSTRPWSACFQQVSSQSQSLQSLVSTSASWHPEPISGSWWLIWKKQSLDWYCKWLVTWYVQKHLLWSPKKYFGSFVPSVHFPSFSIILQYLATKGHRCPNPSSWCPRKLQWWCHLDAWPWTLNAHETLRSTDAIAITAMSYIALHSFMMIPLKIQTDLWKWHGGGLLCCPLYLQVLSTKPVRPAGPFA